MSYNRPSLTEIDTRSRADMEANMDAVPIVRRRTVLAAIARASAGSSHELHGHADWIYRQIFADTADTEQLERKANFVGITRRAAALATGTVTVAGDNGAVIPTGTRLGSEAGVELVTTAAAVIAGLAANIPVSSTQPGNAGNLTTGARVAFLSPIAGVSNAAEVAAPGLASGADVESNSQLLDRYLFRVRRPAHGGASHDYVRWALEVPGVTRAWAVGSEMGLGSVTLRFVVEDAQHGPIPNPAEVAAVEDYIQNRGTLSEEREGRPVTARLYVVAPNPAPVDIVLTTNPDDADTRAAVRAELAYLFRTLAEPGGIVPRDMISQTISLAPGLTARQLIAPVADAVPSIGVLPVLGTVSWA